MEISLSNSLFKCHVDDEDWFLLSLWKYTWRAKWSSKREYLYVATTVRVNRDSFRTIYLHRLILNINAKKEEGHHKDENTFNNHRDNLEVMTKSEHKQYHMNILKNKEEEVPF